jgi:hypothetical protein
MIKTQAPKVLYDNNIVTTLLARAKRAEKLLAEKTEIVYIDRPVMVHQDIENKYCKRCHEDKPLTRDFFYWNKKKRVFSNWCIPCCISHAASIKAGKEKNKTRPSSDDPLEKLFITRRDRMWRRHQESNWEGEVVTTRELIDLYKSSGGKCHYTGLEYSLIEHGPLLMTVDRIDSSVGYTKENTVLCCWFVNCAKNIWPLEQMKALWAYLPVI